VAIPLQFLRTQHKPPAAAVLVLSTSLQKVLLATTALSLPIGEVTAQGGVLLEADAALSAEGLISPAFIAIKDGKILSLSRRAPMMARGLKKIQVEGTVVAGMVDAWSGLLPMDLLAQSSRDSGIKVVDSLPLDIPQSDPMEAVRVQVASAAGIAASYIPSGGNEMNRGLGAAVGFSVNDLPLALGFEALDLAMGGVRMGGVDQFPATKQVARLFSSSEVWRVQLDEFAEKMEKYEKDLEEYRKKLAEYKEKKAKEGDDASAEEKGEDEEELKAPARPKRPIAPQLSRAQTWQMEALYGERQVRIYADSAYDIRAALQLKQEYELDMVIVGGGQADLIAEEIAATKVPVILAAQSDHAGTHPERSLFNRYQTLRAAEVEIALSSGANEGTAASLLITGGQLVANGAEADEVWASLSSIPAKLIGLEGQYGAIKAGAAAELILFSGPGVFQGNEAIRVYHAHSGFSN